MEGEMRERKVSEGHIIHILQGKYHGS